MSEHDELKFISAAEFPVFDEIDSTTIVDDGEPQDADNELDDDYEDPELVRLAEEVAE